MEVLKAALYRPVAARVDMVEDSMVVRLAVAALGVEVIGKVVVTAVA